MLKSFVSTIKETLQEIITELQRLFNVQIVIRDKALLKEIFFVTFAQGLWKVSQPLSRLFFYLFIHPFRTCILRLITGLSISSFLKFGNNQ